MFRLSVSKTGTFESCKLKYKMSYILKLKPKDFTFFALGKMLHETLENFHKALIEDPEMNQSKMMAKFFKAAWITHGEELDLDGKCKLNDIDKKVCFDIIDSYLKRLAQEETPANIIGVEKQFAVDIDGLATIVGMIDRIQIDPDGMMHVIDYKSSKSTKYYEDKFFQLKVYAYIMMVEDPKLQTIRGSYMFLKHNFSLITKEFHRDEIMKMGAEIVDWAEKMQAEKEFPANISFMCKFCGFAPVCDSYQATQIVKHGKASW